MSVCVCVFMHVHLCPGLAKSGCPGAGARAVLWRGLRGTSRALPREGRLAPYRQPRHTKPRLPQSPSRGSAQLSWPAAPLAGPQEAQLLCWPPPHEGRRWLPRARGAGTAHPCRRSWQVAQPSRGQEGPRSSGSLRTQGRTGEAGMGGGQAWRPRETPSSMEWPQPGPGQPPTPILKALHGGSAWSQLPDPRRAAPPSPPHKPRPSTLQGRVRVLPRAGGPGDQLLRCRN